MDTLAGKVALITGATKGIGKAIAQLFAREGAKVAIGARRIEDAQRMAAELGDSALPVALEVSDRAAWNRAVAAIDQRWGRLDVLVNCAGISEPATTEAVTDESWHQHMRTNLDGPFHGCRASLPLMRRSGAPASVINISSFYGQRPSPGFAAYATSKAALTHFTKVFALECAAAKLPIRVNSVHPGGTRTEMLEKVLSGLNLSPEKLQEHYAKTHPMGRLGEPEEVAQACLWLASDASSFTTGSEINVDGGARIRY